MFRIEKMISLAIALVLGTNARGQTPVGTITGIPPPDFHAASTTLRYDSSGDLYAWDGLSVWKQTGGTGSFSNIGSVAAGNSADAGPISFSQDGNTLLLSNGAGGALGGSFNGEFFTMPATGGTDMQVSGSVPYAYDALALPAASTLPGSSTKYVVYQGSSSYSSSVSVFDSATGANQPVINNGPGATTAIAINPTTNGLYVGVYSLATLTTSIYSFRLGQIDNAYNTQTPLDFLTTGALFNPAGTGTQSGAGMFFDRNGYLFSGGDGITVFNPSGVIVYDQPAPGGYAWLTYDPANNDVLVVPYGSSNGMLYSAASFEPASALWKSSSGGSWGTPANWGGTIPGTAAALVFAGSTTGIASVALNGDRTASALQFGDSSALSSYAITSGSGGTLTLGTSYGASIMVTSGSPAISAAIVLTGDLDVSAAVGTGLQLAEVDQAAGISAALNLSGGGELVLSGTNCFTGGVAVIGGTLDLLQPCGLPDGSSLTVGDPMFFGGAVSSAAAARERPATVPEPCSFALLVGIGTVGIILRRRFRLVVSRRFA